jgi:CRP-like cAMP-binding protein
VADKLEPAGAFAALVLEGMLLENLRLGERTAARLLGPGDVVSAPGASDLTALSDSSIQAAAPTRLAMLGNELLAGVRRWPQLMAGLHVRSAQQAERLAAQLVICQMPRVEDRLMALLWLLADSWGRVTVNGTTLPLSLTHGTLGALIGARRPTVTLALGELTERGAIVSQDQGWLLVEEMPKAAKSVAEIRLPRISPDRTPEWADGNGDGRDDGEGQKATRAELMETVAEMRARHEKELEVLRVRLRLLRQSREHWGTVRTQIMRDRLNRDRQTPSS